MEHKDRTVTVAIITGVGALLLGCCLGAMFGVMGGIFIGHQSGNRSVQRPASVLPATPMLPDFRGKGALVQQVIANSPADKAGLQIADVITAVDGTPIDANHRLADLVAQYQPGDSVKISIRRTGETKSISVTLGENPQDSTRPYLGLRYVSTFR